MDSDNRQIPVTEVQSLIQNLASKSDLEILLETIVNKFKDEISQTFESLKTEIREQNQTIESMPVEIVELNNINLDQSIEINRLSSRLDQLERGDASTIITNETTVLDSEIPNNEESQLDTSISSNTNDTKPVIELALCGDSLTKWVDMSDLYPDGRKEKMCLKGAKIGKIRDAVIDLHNQYEVKQLIVHGGCNQIPHDSPLQVASDIIDFLIETKHHMPRTKLYFSAILPKVDNTFTPGINEINSLVLLACDALGVTFIQHPRFSREGVMNENLFTLSDYIHLNRRGVRQFVFDMKKALA